MSDLLKVGVLGLGNGGGNVADFAAQQGFSAIAVNGATKDLDRLSDNVLKFPIGDGKGTGKSRETAKQFLTNHIGMLDDLKMAEFLGNNDVIFIVSSTGGGLGSGASVLMAKEIQKKYPDKAIVPCGIFPFDSEGYTAQEHSVEWMKELKEDTEFAYMCYDNNRFAKLPPNEVCDKINTEIVTAMRIFRGDFTSDDRTGGIDERDMLTTGSIAGRIVAYYMPIEESDIVDGSLVETILECIKKESGNAELADDKQIIASAFQFQLHPQFQKYVPQIKEDMQRLCGDHLNDYSNFGNLADGDETPDGVSIILSGLSEPALRIDRMINRRDKMADTILARRAATSKLDSTSVGNDKLRLNAKSFAAGVAPKRVPIPNNITQENGNTKKK